MRGWVVRLACHAVVAACITFLLVFHVATSGDLSVSAPPPVGAVFAALLPRLWLTPLSRPPPPARASFAAVAAPVARLLDDAVPTKSLPALPHPYVYATWTLKVTQPPGGHYSTVLDRQVRKLAREFFAQEARPLRDVQLVKVVRQREVTPTLHATYYAAVMANSAPALKAFGEYCGWSRTVGGGSTPPAVPTPSPLPSSPPSSDPAQQTPAPSPQPTPADPSLLPPGSELAADLRRLPDMARMSAKLVAPVSLDTHAGEEGAVVNAEGVVTPLEGSKKKGHGPGLAISLAVGLSVTAAVVVAGAALIIHRRRSDRYAPWLAASRRSSAATDADGGRRTSTVGDGGGAGGGGGGWHRPRWTLASFSLSPPARPPRAAQQAPTKGGGEGQERQKAPSGEKRVSWK